MFHALSSKHTWYTSTPFRIHTSLYRNSTHIWVTNWPSGHPMTFRWRLWHPQPSINGAQKLSIYFDEWKTNLMSLATLFHLLRAQHVSDTNISIFRSLRLCWWITTSVVLFSVRCVLEFWCGWFLVVFVLQASAATKAPTHNELRTRRPMW